MLIFNHSRAMTQVRELRAIANDMARSQTLANAMSRTRTAWEGTTSTQFRGKCESLTSMINAEVANIRAVADSLERTANSIAETERKAQDALNTNTVRR